MSKKIDFNILSCPECRGDLFESSHGVTCLGCNRSYQVVNGKIFFKKYEEDKVVDSLDKVKFFLKSQGNIYGFLINLVSPVCPGGQLRSFIRDNIEGKDNVSINFGSGNSNVSNYVSNVDIFPYPNVDMTCDIENIPIKDDVIDNIINIAVLEHVPNPEVVVGEFRRVLKKGGKIICFFPFMQAFHASPHDYSRRTIEGMKVLFKDYEIESVLVTGGPTSGVLWVIQEYVAVVLSFGYKPLYNVLYIILMLASFPIKYLDFLLIKNRLARNCASGFTVIAVKN